MKLFDFNDDDLTEEEKELLAGFDDDEEDEEVSDEKPLSLVWIFLFVAVVAVLTGGFYYWYIGRTYKDFEIKEEVPRNDEERIDYMDFGGNLFSYSLDGASCTDYDDLLLWSESFDMENPVADRCDNYLLLFDKQRSQLILFNTDGVVNEQTMTLPIVTAAVAGNGNVAVLMQEADTGYLELFSNEGKTLASGEIHMQNGGYPIAMDLNDDGNKMMVSILDLNDGDIKTTLSFYDFTDAGKKAKNNITANFSYADMVIPEVTFTKGDRAVAFGDNELIFYTVGQTPKVKSEVFVNDTIKTIFHNDKNVGIITVPSEGGEELYDRLTLYSNNGQARFTEDIEDGYTTCEINENNEVILSDRENINIYTKFGIHKFSYRSEETIYRMLPWDGATNYYLIKKKETDKIKLR